MKYILLIICSWLISYNNLVLEKNVCHILAMGQSNMINMDSAGSGGCGAVGGDNTIQTYNLFGAGWETADNQNTPPATALYGGFQSLCGYPQSIAIAEALKDSECSSCDTVKVVVVAKSGINIGWFMNGNEGRNYLDDQLAQIGNIDFDAIFYVQGPGNIGFPNPDQFADSLDVLFNELYSLPSISNSTEIILGDQTFFPNTDRETIEHEKYQYCYENPNVTCTYYHPIIQHVGDNSHFTAGFSQTSGQLLVDAFCKCNYCN